MRSIKEGKGGNTHYKHVHVNVCLHNYTQSCGGDGSHVEGDGCDMQSCMWRGWQSHVEGGGCDMQSCGGDGSHMWRGRGGGCDMSLVMWRGMDVMWREWMGHKLSCPTTTVCWDNI